MLQLPDCRQTADGGQGARANDAPDLSRADVRMMGQAIRNRWPIREEMRAKVMDTLTFIALDPINCGFRESVAAAKALLDADRLNMEEEVRQHKGPEVIELGDGRKKLDFSKMSDEELDAFLQDS